MQKPIIRDVAFELIKQERQRQEDIHPLPKWTKDSQFLPILVEEVGEVAQAMQEGNGENLEEELIQVAAVCIRWLEYRGH